MAIPGPRRCRNDGRFPERSFVADTAMMNDSTQGRVQATPDYNLRLQPVVYTNHKSLCRSAAADSAAAAAAKSQATTAPTKRTVYRLYRKRAHYLFVWIKDKQCLRACLARVIWHGYKIVSWKCTLFCQAGFMIMRVAGFRGQERVSWLQWGLRAQRVLTYYTDSPLAT